MTLSNASHDPEQVADASGDITDERLEAEGIDPNEGAPEDAGPDETADESAADDGGHGPGGSGEINPDEVEVVDGDLTTPYDPIADDYASGPRGDDHGAD